MPQCWQYYNTTGIPTNLKFQPMFDSAEQLNESMQSLLKLLKT